MNILMLGNGYDLNYYLPTAYRNFLLTINFLTKHNIDDIKNIGDVFGHSDLQAQDHFIKKSYILYKEVYDNIVLNKEDLQKLIDFAKDNPWYAYFIKSFNKDVGWIDFEKEIAFVVDCFQTFFESTNVFFNTSETFGRAEVKYIVTNVFNFFISDEIVTMNIPQGIKRILREYIKEYPVNSGNQVIDKEKIIGVLAEKLKDFTEMLRIYLQCFIEKTTVSLIELNKISQLQAFEFSDIVITFNYTKTYETLNSNTQTFHLHGNTSNKIVLGINADESDDGEEIETSFVSFKKYYQRTLYDTDTEYLRWLRNLLDESANDDIHLLIMGHSLDITDEDYISDLISLSNNVTIIYHDEMAKADQIKNLIRIFGKKEFDKIRDERHLEFLPLDMDFSEFSKKRESNSEKMRILLDSIIL